LSGNFKNPVANKIFGLFRKFQLLCTTKDHLNTIGLGPVTFDYFSMEPTGLLLVTKLLNSPLGQLTPTILTASQKLATHNA
jgi:hypothetical protein